jgi:hypothetical protein
MPRERHDRLFLHHDHVQGHRRGLYRLRTADPFVVLTPGSIYRQLGKKRPSCGSCLPLITKLMVAYDEEGPASAASGSPRSPFEER